MVLKIRESKSAGADTGWDMRRACNRMEGKGLKRRRPILCVTLWCVFIGLIGLIAYVSFQNGEESKDIGLRFMSYCDAILSENQALEAFLHGSLFQSEYTFRQIARIMIFFVLGVAGTVVMRLTFPRMGFFIRLALSGILLTGVAFLSERIKLYISTRHYSYQEMMISIAAVMAGCVVMSVLWAFGSFCSRAARKRIYAGTNY